MFDFYKSLIYIIKSTVVITRVTAGFFIKGMVLNDGLSHLDHLFQKSLRYQHHKENYKISLKEGIIPTGLKIKEEPGFVPVTGQFNKK